jgi:hypothetical protein
VGGGWRETVGLPGARSDRGGARGRRGVAGAGAGRPRWEARAACRTLPSASGQLLSSWWTKITFSRMAWGWGG